MWAVGAVFLWSSVGSCLGMFLRVDSSCVRVVPGGWGSLVWLGWVGFGLLWFVGLVSVWFGWVWFGLLG